MRKNLCNKFNVNKKYLHLLHTYFFLLFILCLDALIKNVSSCYRIFGKDDGMTTSGERWMTAAATAAAVTVTAVEKNVMWNVIIFM